MHRPLVDALILSGARAYACLWHRWSSNGPAPVPTAGPALLVSNHTCSADPMFLLAGSPRLISFAVAREHVNIHPLARRLLNYARCVGVKRNGRDPEAARQLIRRLADGCLVGIFPEGNLSGVDRRRLGQARHGAAFLALVTRAPVFPVYITGGPCTDQLLRSWLLPSRRPVRVTYGPPVDLAPYYDRPRTRRLLDEVTQHLMACILQLRPKETGSQRSEVRGQRSEVRGVVRGAFTRGL
jgi:1-acyl-sn-glycerol-3-phosphate acyltransferase